MKTIDDLSCLDPLTEELLADEKLQEVITRRYYSELDQGKLKNLSMLKQYSLLGRDINNTSNYINFLFDMATLYEEVEYQDVKTGEWKIPIEFMFIVTQLAGVQNANKLFNLLNGLQ